MKVTAITGYTMFSVMVITEIINIAQVTNSIVGRPAAIRERVLTLFVIISLSALLPPLIAYFAGDRATKVKSKLEHHYNGVLFGVTAFWLWLFTTTISWQWIPIPDVPFIPGQIMQFWPSFAVALVMMILGIWYIVVHKQNSLIKFKPFQLLLMGSFAGVFIMSGISLLATIQHKDNNLSAALYSVIPLGTLVVMLVISFISSRSAKNNYVVRLTDATVAAAIGGLATTIAGGIFSRIYSDSTVVIILCSMTGLAAWAAYIHAIRRAS